ncbi:MAG TPA: class I SAM-dependent methyltransferase [Bdellovibrio sp.]|nr:class I SAM-dependent methyltransferase [Bdellovibrio sp.]
MSQHPVAPEHTAVRVSLWRALHVFLDAKPSIFDDQIGMKLVGDENWRQRPDMDPQGSRKVRASIAARARFIEELVEEQNKLGVDQYVILGAGLDTFAQRRQDLVPRLKIFEVDQPGPQAWKRQRLHELGFETPIQLHFVTVDFEAGQSWWQQLVSAGFDPNKPAVVVSTGVSMYLTKEANTETLRQMANLAPGSTFAMTFLLSLNLLNDEDRILQETTMKYAAMSGTPFVSLFAPGDLLNLANDVGFKTAQYFSPDDMIQRYFVNRKDGLLPPKAECFLIVKT